MAWRGTSARWDGNTAVLRLVSLAGASALPGWMEAGQLQVEADGNTIDAGSGDDYVGAGTGHDIVHGGDGDDDLVGMDGDDRLFGDAGADFLWGDGLQIDPATYTPHDRHGSDTLVGGSGNDVLVGQGGSDVLLGGNDDDVLWGDDADLVDTPAALHGNDVLDGGSGNDELFGGGRDDDLAGGSGNDSLWGDGGQPGDVPPSYQGSDRLDGGQGDDLLVGGGLGDTLIGGAGNDSIVGDDKQSRLDAAVHGDDVADGGDGHDVIDGGGGADRLAGGRGHDQLRGDDAVADLDVSTHGDDLLEGDDGEDTLIGGGGADRLFGGEGADELRGDDAGIALARQQGDLLDGGAGSDSLFGEGGNDTLVGGTGVDYLDGGAGDDVYVFAAGDGEIDSQGVGDTIHDAVGVNRVVIEGAGTGSITVGSALIGAGTGLAINFGVGEGLVIAGGVSGSVASYEIGGEVFTTSALIGRFSDTAMTETDPLGRTHAVGGRGGDNLAATSASATLSGGRGNDTLAGNGGRNTYLYSRGDGDDRIVDTSAKTDGSGNAMPNRLVFEQGVVLADVSLAYAGSQLILRIGDAASGDVVRVEGFDASDARALAGGPAVDEYVFADGQQFTYAQLVARGFDLSGTSGDDALAGTDLDDRFDGGAGSDTLSGGAGSDRYAWGADAGNDLIVDTGGAGDLDLLDLAATALPADVRLYRNGDDLVVRLQGAADQVSVSGWFASAAAGIDALRVGDSTVWDRATIASRITNELTDAADTYTATAGNDLVGGRAGNDTINGAGGHDTLDGDAGSDSLLGGDGDDVLTGGAAADTLSGGNGLDTLDGRDDAAADLLRGGNGADLYLFGRGSGADVIDDGGTDAASIDVLRLDAGIAPGDVRLTGRYPITLTIVGTGDSISFGPDTGNSRIERIEFADGTVWNAPQWQQRALLDSATEGNDSLIAFQSIDTLIVGLGGNDTLTSYGGHDTLDGGAGNDRLDAGDGHDSLIGGAGQDTLDGGFTGNDTLDGGAGTDSLSGGAGNDLLVDGETMNGGQGDDTYVVASSSLVTDAAGQRDVLILPAAATPQNVTAAVAYSASSQTFDDLTIAWPGGATVRVEGFFATADADSIEELHFADGTRWTRAELFSRVPSGLLSDADDTAVGFRWNDSLDGLAGNDVIAGKFGDDTLRGGAGNDRLEGDSYTTTWTGDGHDSLAGDAGSDTVYGAGGNDSLDGGSGLDELYGGDGNDTYVLSRSSGRDRISDTAGADRILFAADILPGSVTLLRNGNEFIVAVDQAVVQARVLSHFGSGTGRIESIHFADGTVWDAQEIDARTIAGVADTQTGTAGNDSFVVDNAADVINESLGGIDTVLSSVSWTLGANLENLGLTGYLDASAIGNELANVLTGNAGNNLLDGLGGADTLQGGLGDDTYRANMADSVIEAAGAGIDSVIADNDYTLSANVENLTVVPVYYRGHQLVGNALDNTLSISNSSSGNLIDGGAGADTMISSGMGWSLFLVDNPGDTLVARYDGHAVVSTVDWTLAANMEILQLKGSASLGTGNADHNLLIGNGRNDLLLGLGGNDTLHGDYNAQFFLPSSNLTTSWDASGVDSMSGGIGNDTYYVSWSSSGIDVVIEDAGEGVDTVVIAGDVRTYAIAEFANVENLRLQFDQNSSLIGGDGANQLGGSKGSNLLDGRGGDDALDDGDAGTHMYSGADTLLGGAGDDTLSSAKGDDWLEGGSGADTLYVTDSSGATIRYGRGQGADRIHYGGTNGASRRIELSAGLSPADLDVLRQGRDLQLDFGQGDVMTLVDHFADASSTVPRGSFAGLRFDDGVLLTEQMLIDRMLNGNRDLPGPDADLIFGSASADAVDGAAGNDTLFGFGGADTLAGDFGNDLLRGGTGDDTYRFRPGDGLDRIEDEGGIGDIVAIEGVSPEGVQVSRTGNDLRITLSATSDRIVVAGFFGSTANRIEALRFADGTVWSAVELDDMATRVTGTGGEDVLTGSDAPDRMFGLEGNDSLHGLAGDDQLDGGQGADSMVGGLGSDRFVVDHAGDTVVETANEGYDTIHTSIAYALPAAVEVLIADGSAGLALTGNAEANELIGSAGHDTLDGAAGADWLAGGAGDDVNVLDHIGDGLVEEEGEGSDVVRSSVTTTLGDHLENLVLTGSTALSGTGNALDNQLTGNAANNSLSGGAGKDTLDGGSGNDTMVGGTGDDLYHVNASGDVVTEASGGGVDQVVSTVTHTLGSQVENLVLAGTSAINGSGNSLSNVLSGNSAANQLSGGGGNDTYHVGAGDTVVESSGAGTDEVFAGVTWTLATNIENLTLTGTAAINGTGNASSNRLRGNSAANTLSGGSGADTMSGGAGNDAYVVDSSADVIVEQSGEGTDSVSSGVSFTLAANIENLALTGSSAINGTGNALDNLLAGNSGANVLTGGAGNDTYVVGTGDTVTEATGAGTDTVQSGVTWTLAANVENLLLTGTSAINGTGNAEANLLTGNSGANTLAGLGGNDTYTGGAGNDTLTDSSTTSGDVYHWGTGQGNDSITDAGGNDAIEIAAGVSAAQIVLTRSSNDLRVTITGASDVLTVRNWYLSAANRIEQIRLHDGTIIDAGGAAPAALISGTKGGVRAADLPEGASSELHAMGMLATDPVRSARLLVELMTQFTAEAAQTDGAALFARPELPMRATLATPL